MSSDWIAVFSGTRRELDDASEALVRSSVKLVVGRGARIYVGDAKGVDALVRETMPYEGSRVFKADWDAYGKGGGPKRNLAMLEAALKAVGGDTKLVRVYAFPCSLSSGTFDCVKRAAKMGIASYVSPVTRKGG